VPVQLRPISASQVFKDKMALLFDNLGVLSTDGAIVESDLTGWVTPQHDCGTRKRKDLTCAIAFDDLKKWHSRNSLQ
jgi:hypothetical protein